ncbi:hypothetical protein HY410_01060 [Candidatus Gottesmanbacteria bacterium]|nr:hypothetical protein [Candidatus Gottesmanbacteria bacterium]
MNIVLSLILMVITIAGGSIAWPRLTSKPRPAPLQEVHNIIKDTSLGKSFANVLGIADQQPIEPINVASEASKLTANIMKSAQERAAKIVVTQAVRGLLAQIGNLPPVEQAQIHEALCTPPTPSP